MAIRIEIKNCVSTLFLTFLFSFGGRVVLAADGHLYFKGHIVSDQDTIRLRVSLARNPITGYGEYEYEERDVKIDRHGNFSISFSGVTRPGRLILWDRESSVSILANAVVEPGDSIVADLDIHTGANGLELKASFSGRNFEKYSCAHEMDAHRDAELSIIQEYNKKRVISLADSVMRVKMEVLERYRKDISEESYHIMKCDILGSIYEKVLFGLCGGAAGVYVKGTWTRSGAAAKAKFDSVSAIIEKDIDPPAMGMSLAYMDFLYKRTLWEYVFRHPEDKGFSLPAFCKQVVSEYQGPLRDHLLALTLLNDMNISGTFQVVDCKEYTDCLRKGVSMIGAPWIRNEVAEKLKSRGMGQEAFDFNLPADSSGELVSLRSLRGKVVLLDMWGYQCTGCTEFAQAFHKAVYPLFKDDSNFRVVSILASLTPYNLYLYRLRSTPQPGLEQYSTYTYPDYINLFGGKGQDSGRMLAKHYNITADPFIVLIDRQGKIYSSTVPFFTDTQSENVSKMVQMIKEALKEKS